MDQCMPCGELQLGDGALALLRQVQRRRPPALPSDGQCTRLSMPTPPRWRGASIWN